MLSLHLLSLQNKPPSSLAQLCLITKKPKTPISQLLVHGGGDNMKKRRSEFCSFSSSTSFSKTTVHAVEKDSQQFEIDSDKAKEALKQLDQQIQSLSKKQVSPPKIKAADVNLTRDQMKVEIMPEISESFLAYSAVVLVIFTIFYNVLFYTVIKPSIDGPEESGPASTDQERVSSAAVLQLLPSTPEVFFIQQF